MFGRLLPQEGRFFELFNAHADQCVRAAHEMAALMKDFANRDKYAQAIDEAEHAADRITADTIRTLHKTFITPIDRNDIHRLITRMDDIMDFVEAAAERIALYEITVMTVEVRDLADVLVRASEQVELASRCLRNLKDPATILKLCVDINRLENEGDQILRRAVAKLFRENANDAITVIKWKEIYENLEAATDRCEDVANIIEGVVLEHG
jgi:predicted phosphate transport protein (TIGR00153 family)